MKASVRFVDATALMDLVYGGELRQKPKEKNKKVGERVICHLLLETY